MDWEVAAVLRENSEVLRSTEEQFERPVRHQLGYIKIYCYLEELKVPAMVFIVSQGSTTLRSYTSSRIHADHSDMVKF